MTKYLVLISILGLLMSCGKNKLDKPNNLIAESQMVDIIVDFALLNSGQGLDKSVFEREGIVPNDFIYAKYGIDSTQFIKSNEYYSHDISVYQNIYSEVRSRLNQKKDTYKKISAEETKAKKIQDSIRRAKKNQVKDSLMNLGGYKALKKVKYPVKKIDSSS